MPAPRPGVRRLVATWIVIGVAAVIAAVFAAADPARIPTLAQTAYQNVSIADTVATIRFYGGVAALVALSLTVTAGLLASDRLLLGVRQRVWAQSAHRTLGALTVIFLMIHVLTEVAAHRIAPLAAAAPFVTTSLYLGLGSVAAYLILAVMWTGLIRARFADSSRPQLWRVLHAAGYLGWPIALLHGLRAGRPPATWVIASYVVLLALAMIALGLRLSTERRRRRARTAGAITGRPITPALGLPTPPRAAPTPAPLRSHPSVSLSAPVPAPTPASAATPVSAPAAFSAPLVEPVAAWIPAMPAPVTGRPAAAPATPDSSRQWGPSAAGELPTVVNLAARRKSRDGDVGARPRRRRNDDPYEMDERYLAALRGEAQ